MTNQALWDMEAWDPYLSSLREEHSEKHYKHHGTQEKGAHLGEDSSSPGNLNLSMNWGLQRSYSDGHNASPSI